MKEVFITRVSGFLPNDPIGNDEMEGFLGFINDAPSRARHIVLRNNGIKRRFYALDKQRRLTHTNAELVFEAVKGLTENGLALTDLEVLACGTSAPDQFLPSHASQVHGLMPHAMEIISPSGACCAGMQALKYAHMSVASGNSRNAVATGSELISPMMMAENFQTEAERIAQLEKNPMIAFEKEFLRWMLSDGAGAALLEAEPRGECDLQVEWVVSRSFANELEACMYFGAEKEEGSRFRGWKTYSAAELAPHSIMSMKQDTRLLGKHMVPVAIKWLREVMDQKGVDIEQVQHFLPHLSSMYFRAQIEQELVKHGLHVKESSWFLNLTEVGNIGSASIYLMLRDLIAAGKVKKGDRVLLMVPESARFSLSFALLKAV
ncbi:MAG: beta-ketoacyl-ACP synthase III [Flavobacteriales bacterium]